MSEILITSDLHIHAHKKSINRIDDCLRVLDWVFDTAKENKINDIVFLGDLFHDRQKIDVLTYQKTFELFVNRLIPEPLGANDHLFKVHLLIGNHDMYHRERWDINSVSPLNVIPGIKVIDKPETINILGHKFDFMPHAENPINGLSSFKGKRRYLCAHLAVHGAILNSSGMGADVIVEHDGEMIKVDADCFSKWDHAFLGHYHAQQQVADNVEYVGSPLQLNFGESFQTKHLCIFNPETQERKYVVNDFSPRHLIIPQADVKKYDLEGNFVRVVVDDITSTEVMEMHQELRKGSGASSLELKPSRKKVDQEHLVSDAKAILYNEDEMLEKYLDDVGTGELNEKKLLAIGKTICEEAGND